MYTRFCANFVQLLNIDEHPNKTRNPQCFKTVIRAPPQAHPSLLSLGRGTDIASRAMNPKSPGESYSTAT